MAQRLAAISGVIGLLVIGAAARGQAGGPGGPPALVRTEPARLEPVARNVSVVGTVQPARRSVVASEIAGIVVDVPIWEGDRVEKGQLLVGLRTDLLEYEHRQALAELARLEQRLAELEAGSRKEELAAAKAGLEQAQALLRSWEVELQKVQTSYEAGAATPKEYRDTVAQYQAALARQAQAQAQYELVQAGPRAEQIAQARQAVAAQQAMANLVADRIEKASVEAPFTGYVVRKMVEVGEWVQAGGPVVELIELDTVLVTVDVPEEYIAKVETGLASTVRLDALGAHVDGTVAHVVPQASPASRAFPVEIAVPNGQGRIKAGMFARALLPLGEPAEQIVVPKDAVRTTPQGTIVFTVVDGKAVPVPVIVTGGLEQSFTVEGQLRPGMPVVVRGNERLMPGQAVVAADGPGQPGGAATQPSARAAGGE